MIVSVHRLRRAARRQERQIQRSLDITHDRNLTDGVGYARATKDFERVALDRAGVPNWAHGVRVEKAGFFQWAVVATDRKGH